MSIRDRRIPWALGFAVLAVVNVAAEFADLATLATVTKVCLMPTLIGLIMACGSRPLTRGDHAVLLALLFAWFGDILLTPSGKLFFYAGLACFAVTQAAYLRAFNSGEGQRRAWDPRIGIPYALWWLLLVVPIAPKVGIATIAVAIYGALLLSMAATSWRVAVITGIGGLLFALSDSLIALTSLSNLIEFKHSGAAIMATYSIGQFLIVWGWLTPAVRTSTRMTVATH